MKLNKAEYIVESKPEYPLLFDMRMNDSNNCAKPNWQPLREGTLETVLAVLLQHPERIKRMKITVTYR